MRKQEKPMKTMRKNDKIRKKMKTMRTKYEPMKTMIKPDEKTRRTRVESAFIFLICTLSKPYF